MGTRDVQLLGPALFRELVERARHSLRRRVNHNFHRSMEENPHRFLNVMVRGTYITPHRHLEPPKSESCVILEGEVAFFEFDDEGRVSAVHHLGRDVTGIDIQAGIWHTIAVLSDYAVCFEVKPGPYSAANDKDFAPWAPREGHPEVESYLHWLLEQAAVKRDVSPIIDL